MTKITVAILTKALPETNVCGNFKQYHSDLLLKCLQSLGNQMFNM